MSLLLAVFSTPTDNQRTLPRLVDVEHDPVSVWLARPWTPLPPPPPPGTEYGHSLLAVARQPPTTHTKLNTAYNLAITIFHLI